MLVEKDKTSGDIKWQFEYLYEPSCQQRNRHVINRCVLVPEDARATGMYTLLSILLRLCSVCHSFTD